jgi:hypothetical protein
MTIPDYVLWENLSDLLMNGQQKQMTVFIVYSVEDFFIAVK